MKLKYQSKRFFIEAFFFDGHNLHGLMDFIEETGEHNSSLIEYVPTDSEFMITINPTRTPLQDNTYLVRNELNEYEYLDEYEFRKKYENLR